MGKRQGRQDTELIIQVHKGPAMKHHSIAPPIKARRLYNYPNDAAVQEKPEI